MTIDLKDGSRLFQDELDTDDENPLFGFLRKSELDARYSEKTDDGYHELRTILQKISLHDTLRFTLKQGKGVTLTTDHPFLPTGKENLVYRAAQLILVRSNYGEGFTLILRRGFPSGQGWEGGAAMRRRRCSR